MRKRDAAAVERNYPDVVELYDPSVPVVAHLWVLKAGITPERATNEYGFGYSPETNRVVVPVLHNGDPTGVWTGRSINGGKPKYRMPSGAVGSCWYELRRHRTPCVVVEDVLSAIRVSEAGFNSCAILGTSVSQEHALLLSEHRVVGWFDGDDAGRAGYVKLRKALSVFGVDPKRVVTEKDPKAYSSEQIREYITEAL